MNFLVLCRPAATAAEEEIPSYRDRELEALRELRDHAGLTDIYSPGRFGAVLMFEASDAADVQRSLDTLPMRQAGLITTEVIPLYPLDIDAVQRP